MNDKDILRLILKVHLAMKHLAISKHILMKTPILTVTGAAGIIQTLEITNGQAVYIQRR